MAIRGSNSVGGGASLFAQIQQKQQPQAPKKTVASTPTASPTASAETKRQALATKAKSQQLNAGHARVTDKSTKKQQISKQLKTVSAAKVESNSQQLRQKLGNTASSTETSSFIKDLGPSQKSGTLPKLPAPNPPTSIAPPPPPKKAPTQPAPVKGGITAESLQEARAKLKKVSQHQVLNLGDITTGSTTKESALSRKLGSEVGGVPLDRDRLPGPQGSIDIVGHSSDGGMKIEGKSPQQLAQVLKAQFGVQQLKTINLVSCESKQFKAEFQQALSELGVEVGEVNVSEGRVAVDRATGKTLDEAVVGDLSQVKGHDGGLGLEKNKIKAISDDSGVPENQIELFVEQIESSSSKTVGDLENATYLEYSIKQKKAIELILAELKSTSKVEKGAETEPGQLTGEEGWAIHGKTGIYPSELIIAKPDLYILREIAAVMIKNGSSTDMVQAETNLKPSDIENIAQDPDGYIKMGHTAKMVISLKEGKGIDVIDEDAAVVYAAETEEANSKKALAPKLIVEPTMKLSSGEYKVREVKLGQRVTCHQYAYDKANDPNFVPSYGDIVQRAKDMKTPIAVCFNAEKKVAHSAIQDPKNPDRFVQMLQGQTSIGEASVEFITKRAALTKAYKHVLVCDPKAINSFRLAWDNYMSREK